MKFKITAVLLAAAVAAGTLAGCGGTTKTQEATTKKQYTIKIFTTRVTPDSNSDVMQKIQTKLGQKLEVTAVADADYGSKLNLYVASNEMPDIYQAVGSTDAMKLSATLTESDLKSYMPGAYKLFTDRLKTYGFDKTSVMSDWMVNGKLKEFGTGNINNYTPYGLIINTSILSDLGVQMPKTISDWDAVLKAYKAKYPNKYPITAKAKDSFGQSFYMFFAAYGLTFSGWLVKDKKLALSTFLPEWKDCLTQLQTWYKAGYINPEWFTMNSQAYNNEFINGNTLCYQYWNTGNQIDPPYNAGTVLAQAVAKNPNAKFAWCPFPA